MQIFVLPRAPNFLGPALWISKYKKLAVKYLSSPSSSLNSERLFRVSHYLPRQVKFYSLNFHVIDIKRHLQRNKLLYHLERCHFTEYPTYSVKGQVKNINILNMVSVSRLQVKKWRWGKLSQISQGKLSAPKYCEFSNENCE